MSQGPEAVGLRGITISCEREEGKFDTIVLDFSPEAAQKLCTGEVQMFFRCESADGEAKEIKLNGNWWEL